MQKVVSLIRSHLLSFVFVCITVGDGSKNLLLQFMSRNFLRMFSSRSFIVFGLTFRSLLHLSLFVCGVSA